MNKKYTGINIQWPISQDILSGVKSIETRTYPLPSKYIGKTLLIIETPGKKGNFKSRVAGLIKFGEPFEYSDKKAFYEDSTKHLITPNSAWKWASKAKWGWPILEVKKLRTTTATRFKKGIIFTTKISFEDLGEL